MILWDISNYFLGIAITTDILNMSGNIWEIKVCEDFFLNLTEMLSISLHIAPILVEAIKFYFWYFLGKMLHSFTLKY